MCGVVGIYGHPEAANIAYLGLHALQHRGQESAGIVASDGKRLTPHRAMGLVQACFSPSDLTNLRGSAAIGHVRYSTAGGSHIRNAQPFAVDYAHGSIAVAHNGNLTNHEILREKLEDRGSIFQSASDTEVIVHLIAASTGADVEVEAKGDAGDLKHQPSTLESRVAEALKQVEGAYSIVFLGQQEMIAVRDPMGFRPLCVGRMDHPDGTATVVASEPTSFDLIGATYVRDVEPGEMLVVGPNGTRSVFPFERKPRKLCIFEHVYFARPDSRIEGSNVYDVRKAFGRKLAMEQPIPDIADPSDVVVIPVPDSGVPAAIGFAQQAGLAFDMGLIRSHYVGRTFIEPQQSIRHFGVRLKLSPNRAVITGKRVVIVDDSIVRGTTSRKIVKMVRDAGAREVHLRISSPPTRWPCFYGIDTPTRAELIAATHSIDEICKYVTADSLGYLSIEGLVASVRDIEEHCKEGTPIAADSYCLACFNGAYPVPFVTGQKSRHLRVVPG